VVVSLRHQDAVIKLDRTTGRLIWILGDPAGWRPPWSRALLQPEGNITWPYHQHAPEWTPQHTLLMFDNGNFRHRPFDGKPDNSYSRAVEFAIDEVRHTVKEVWSYDSDYGVPFFSGALGDADFLPETGNVLITDGFRVTPGQPADRWGRIIEVTHTKTPQRVFELIVRDRFQPPLNGWRIYRSERLPTLYPPEIRKRTDVLESSRGQAPGRSRRASF
jgi:arylsulfate sulfotransferase